MYSHIYIISPKGMVVQNGVRKWEDGWRGMHWCSDIHIIPNVSVKKSVADGGRGFWG